MIIKDKALEPFFIEVNRYGYTLYESIDNTNNTNKFDKSVGYYVTLDSIIDEIITRKMEGDATVSLKEFISLYKQEADEIKKALK